MLRFYMAARAVIWHQCMSDTLRDVHRGMTCKLSTNTRFCFHFCTLVQFVTGQRERFSPWNFDTECWKCSSHLSMLWLLHPSHFGTRKKSQFLLFLSGKILISSNRLCRLNAASLWFCASPIVRSPQPFRMVWSLETIVVFGRVRVSVSIFSF